jgi:hypothetical protein
MYLFWCQYIMIMFQAIKNYIGDQKSSLQFSQSRVYMHVKSKCRVTLSSSFSGFGFYLMLVDQNICQCFWAWTANLNFIDLSDAFFVGFHLCNLVWQYWKLPIIIHHFLLLWQIVNQKWPLECILVHSLGPGMCLSPQKINFPLYTSDVAE